MFWVVWDYSSSKLKDKKIKDKNLTEKLNIWKEISNWPWSKCRAFLKEINTFFYAIFEKQGLVFFYLTKTCLADLFSILCQRLIIGNFQQLKLWGRVQ